MSSLQKKIEDKLRRKDQELIDLKQKAVVVEAEIKATREFLNLVIRENAAPSKAGQFLKPNSLAGKTHKFLKKKGEPVYIVGILEGIGKANSLNNRRAVGQQLSSYSRQHQIFSRPAPNTFGLLEWGDNTSDEAVTEDQPKDQMEAL